jgi:hypothetical protein
MVTDHLGQKVLFLILDNASPEIIQGASETPAGRIDFVDLSDQFTSPLLYFHRN